MTTTLKEILIMKAEDLPLETQKKIEVYSGFVEVRLEQHSPVDANVIPLKSVTPAQRMLDAMKRAGFEQKNFE